VNIKILDTIEKLNKEIVNIVHCPELAIDTETTGLEWYRHKIFMIQLSYKENVWIIPVYNYNWKHKLNHLFKIINDRIPLLIGHNLKFDLHHIKSSFWVSLLKPKLFDTMIAAHLLDENRPKKLKSLMKSELHIQPKEQKAINQWFKDKKIKKGKRDFSKLPQELIQEYAITDVVMTYVLYERFKPSIERYFHSLFETEMGVVKILFKMEQNGVRIDVPYLEELQQKYEDKILIKGEQIKYRLLEYNPKINLNSSKQIGEYLYKELKMPILKTSEKTNAPSTDTETLQQLDHPFVVDLLHYRKLKKIHSTYIKNLLKYNHNGWIYANFNQSGTDTGRFSCGSPNLQNQAKQEDIKKIFLPDEGQEMIWWDQSQMEMVGFAHYSREPKMIEIFKKGEDIYTGTAQQVLNKQNISKQERQVFKNMNLAMIYCVGNNKLAKYLSGNLKQKVTHDEGIAFREQYLETFTRIKPFMREVMSIAETSRQPWGNYVKNMFGRIRRVDPDKSYTAVNHLIQGWAADLMKESMVRIEKKFNPNWKMQLHDAVRIDRPVDRYRRSEFIQEISECLTNWPQVSVPIRVKVESSKTNWSECKGV